MSRPQVTPVPGLVAALLLALAAPGAEAQEVSLALGTPQPEVTLEDLDGNPVALHDLTRGKPAVIEFWATWCEQCEALQPELDRVQSMYGDRVQVVAVAVGVNQTVRRVGQHLDDHDPGYPFLWDGRGEAVRAYAAFTTSTVVILDADGEVAYTGVGVDQPLVETIERILAR